MWVSGYARGIGVEMDSGWVKPRRCDRVGRVYLPGEVTESLNSSYVGYTKVWLFTVPSELLLLLTSGCWDLDASVLRSTRYGDYTQHEQHSVETHHKRIRDVVNDLR